MRMRTTVDIDKPILALLKKRAQKEGLSLGQLVSQLLALQLETPANRNPRRLKWTAADLGAPHVDLADKAALNAVLDR